MKAPVLRDRDLDPIALPCVPDPKPDDPGRVRCHPEKYVSPLAWDAVDNTIFGPLSRALWLETHGEAWNVNSLDEVPDSAWFENRIAAVRATEGALARGACAKDDVLDVDAPDGAWVIDYGKDDGASLGFRIEVAGKGKFMLKTDSKEQPERPSAASVIGAAIYHATGFHTTCEQVVYFPKRLLKLTPGLKTTDNTGVTRPFDEKALDRALEETGYRGGDSLIRMQASKWLDGKILGPFRYEATRRDDPHDVVPHEDRRDLRGARVLAAWLNHFDAREQNSMDTWVATDPKSSRSPGWVKHHYLDLSDCFGSEWAWDGISRRLGHSYYLDLAHVAGDFVTLGLIERPWDRVQRTPGMELFGYFSAKEFVPEDWHDGYPNPAFSNMTERDGAWMTRVLARFDDDDVRAFVELGKFSEPRWTQWLSDTLIERRRKILRRWLSKLSPVTDVTLSSGASGAEVGSKLCAIDLARRSRLWDDGLFRYEATIEHADSGAKTKLAPTAWADGRVCVELPHVAPDPAAPDDASSRYAIVRLSNGQAKGPLEVHLYDRPSTKGWFLAGILRPES